MSSLLAQHMSRLRNEAKTNFKSNIIYFLDAPNLEHLGFKAKIIGTPKEYQESLLRLNGTELHQEITSASQLIDEKVKFINNIISDFINQKLDLKVKLVNEQLVAHDPDTASKLRLLEINSFLAQQCKLKGSVYFLNSLKAYLQIYPIAYLLQTQGYEDSKLNLDAPVLSSFNSEQKERIKRMSLLFSKSNDACARLSLTAKFAKALCGQNDLGIIYGCALLGLDGLLSSFNELLSLHPNLEVESFINQLAKSFKNEHPVALLRFKDFLVSDSFIRFSSTKNDPNQNQNHPAHQQQRPHAPYIANKSNKGLILTVASDHDATTPAPHGLVLTNAAASAPASEQANNSNSQQDKSGEPLAETKTAKASASASGLVLTNAADSVQENSSNFQQDKGTEPLTAKASASASGLVLTNAADSQSDSSSNSQQNMGNEPLRESERKDAKTSASASGLVLTNAADSVQDNSSNSQQDKDTEPLRETKDAKTSSSSSGLILTNAADSQSDSGSNDLQDKGTESLAETKTVKASASASGLVLTNAADSVQDNSYNSQQDKDTEPLVENKTAKASASASSLVLTNAADSVQENSSTTQQDKGTEPLAETQTAKAAPSASGLVLTNAADSQSDSSSNSQQDKGTEPLAETKTAKASASASGLVLTNAADSVQDNSSNSKQDKSSEPLAENKTAKAAPIVSGLVLTNAADSVQDNCSNSQQDKGTEPVRESERKDAKTSASASGLVLTNAADSKSDSGSNDLQDKSTEPLAETKTVKASASASGLVLTNAADSQSDSSSNDQQNKSNDPVAENKSAKTSASVSGLVLTNAAAIIQEGSKGNSVKTNFSGEQSANLLITTEQYEHAPISKEELFVQNFYSRNLQAIPNVSEKSFSQRAQERYLSILDRIDNNAKENDGKKVFRVAKSIKEEAIKDTSSPEQVNDASKVNSDKQDQTPKVQVIWKTMDGSQPNFEAKTQETTAKASTEALPQGSGHESGSNVEKAAITTAVSTASTEDKGTTKAAISTATATATATETGVTVVKSATGIETKDDSISKNSEETIISRVTSTSDIVTEDSKPKVKAKSAKTSGTTKKKTTGGLKRIKLSNASAGDIWQQAIDLAKDMDSESSKVLTKEEFKASMETQEQATTSMVTTATTGGSVDKATLSQSASNGAIKPDAVTEEMGSKGTASDNSTSNTGKSMPTGTAFMPFEQARRSNIKVLASRHVNDQVIEKDQAAVKIHKGSSSNIGKINPADALRHFDPITGSYIDERPVESEVEVTGESDFNQDSGQFFDNDSLNFDENLIFGDDETFEIWSPDEPNNKDDNQFNEETDLNLDKTLECSNELMRLKYTVLFAQSFLLDQEQYQKLMSAKNLEQLNMYSQLMSSFDDFSELNIEHNSALPNWQTIRASLLTQVINDMPNMPAYKSVLFDLLSRTKDEELSLTKQLAKFNYYNRVIGHTWEVEANNPQGPYANKEQASLAKFENSPGATFILACLFLNISQLHNYACDCFLGSAYTNCGLASPI